MKHLMLIVGLFSSVVLYAQTPDARLYEVWTAEEIAHKVESSPFVIAYYNYFLDHAYKIVTAPTAKVIELPEVEIGNLSKFNILAIQQQQNLKRRIKHPTYYKIANTDKILVLLSEREFTQKLNKYLRRI